MSQVETPNAGAESPNPAQGQEPAKAVEAKPESQKPQDVVTEAKKDGEAPKADANSQPDSTTEQKPEVKFELKLPEGSLLSAKNVEEITALAKEKGLNPEQAQLMLNRENATVSAYHNGLLDQHKKQTEQWIESAKADPEIGGEKFSVAVESAHRALKHFSTPEFNKALNDSGYGNHPELIKVFSRIGKLMSEDKLIQAGEPPAPKKSHLDVIYDNTPQKKG